MNPYCPIDLSRLETVSLSQRPSKVHVGDFARPPKPGASFADFLSSLPRILFGQDIRDVIEATVRAFRNGRPVVVGLGAHVLKCGLSPVLIDLMHRRIVTAIAFNGAGPIHDVEIALVGHTSEDVEAGLKDGTFGTAQETIDLIVSAFRAVNPEKVGLGRAIGKELLRRNPPHRLLSLLATAAELDIPATVHVAIGTDILHMREEASGGAIGAASFTDFRLFTSVVADLTGGVYMNVGSAVILPEVFLKAFTVAQNLGAGLHDFTTVDIDMTTHYRPTVNVVQRPARVGGRGFTLTGRHELILPVLAYAIVEALEKGDV